MSAVTIVLLSAACGQDSTAVSGSAADAIVRHIIETQQIRDIPLKDDGKTDAISGATITIDKFLDVASKAIAEAEA